MPQNIEFEQSTRREIGGSFLPIGGAAAACSFRSLAAAQRLAPVSRLNLFYRHIRAKAL